MDLVNLQFSDEMFITQAKIINKNDMFSHINIVTKGKEQDYTL